MATFLCQAWEKCPYARRIRRVPKQNPAGRAGAEPDNTPGFKGEQRVDTWNQAKVKQTVEVQPDFSLGIKNPEIFLDHLDVFLKAGLPCLISVRHPVSVINSWVLHARKKVDRGEVLRGFANGEAMSFTSDRVSPVERRYEDWFTNLAQLQDLCQFARIPSLGFLRPAPIPPSSIVLHSDEYDAILRGCRLMEELGYASRDGRLLPQELEANIRSTGS